MVSLGQRVEKLELQIYHLKNSDITTRKINLKDYPQPWKIEKPKGLEIFDNALSQKSRDALWKFFHPKNGSIEPNIPDISTGDFPWFQRFKRFPKTAHYNGWHSGKFQGDEESKIFKNTYPELYDSVYEAYNFIKSQNITTIPNIDEFVPGSVSVMRHKPGWGLGRHYDNSQDENTGIVLMITIADNDIVPRTFNFVDGPRGKQFPCKTPDKQIAIFGGECYDLWQHESLRNPKQSCESISLTIRLANVCGANHKNNIKTIYKPGAPAAMAIAHERIKHLIF